MKTSYSPSKTILGLALAAVFSGIQANTVTDIADWKYEIVNNPVGTEFYDLVHIWSNTESNTPIKITHDDLQQVLTKVNTGKHFGIRFYTGDKNYSSSSGSTSYSHDITVDLQGNKYQFAGITLTKGTNINDNNSITLNLKDATVSTKENTYIMVESGTKGVINANNSTIGNVFGYNNQLSSELAADEINLTFENKSSWNGDLVFIKDSNAKPVEHADILHQATVLLDNSTWTGSTRNTHTLTTPSQGDGTHVTLKNSASWEVTPVNFAYPVFPSTSMAITWDNKLNPVYSNVHVLNLSQDSSLTVQNGAGLYVGSLNITSNEDNSDKTGTLTLSGFLCINDIDKDSLAISKIVMESSSQTYDATEGHHHTEGLALGTGMDGKTLVVDRFEGHRKTVILESHTAKLQVNSTDAYSHEHTHEPINAFHLISYRPWSDTVLEETFAQIELKNENGEYVALDHGWYDISGIASDEHFGYYNPGNPDESIDNIRKNQNLELVESSELTVWSQWVNALQSGFDRMHTVHENEAMSGLWVKVQGAEMEHALSNGNFDSDYTTFEIGGDRVLPANQGKYIMGLAFSYTDGDHKFNLGSGSGETYALTAYGAHLWNNGAFLNTLAKFGEIKNSLNMNIINQGMFSGSTERFAWSVSAEAGHSLYLTPSVFVQPSLSATYVHLAKDSYNVGPLSVESDSTESFLVSAGARLGYEFPNQKGRVWLSTVARHALTGDLYGFYYGTDGSTGTTIKSLDDTWGEFALGANVNLNKNFVLVGKVEHVTGALVDTPIRWNLTARYSF